MFIDSNKKHDFIIALDEAIDCFSKYLLKKNSKIFYYRHANLQFVIERYLYFTYSHNLLLMKGYFGEPNLESEDITLVMLAKFMGKKVKYKFNLKSKFIRKIKDFRLFILDIFSKFPCQLKELDQGKILFFIEQEKFKRYFSPITDKISNKKWAYLIKDNLALSKYLQAEKCSYFQYVALLRYRLRGKANKELKNFRYLLKDFDGLHVLLSEIAPKKIVIAEGNSPQHELISQVCKTLNIPVICIQQGWSPIIHTGFRHMSYDKMLIWGQGFADLLQAHNPEQKFIVTGSHVITPKEEKAATSKVMTFFIPNNRKYIKYDRIITETDLENFFKLISWAAQKFPDFLINIREHPGAPLAEEEKALIKNENVHFTPQSCISLNDILYQTAIAITSLSTTILECAACGIPTLIINSATKYKFVPDTIEYGLSQDAGDFEQAQVKLQEIINNIFIPSLSHEGKNSFNKTFFAYGKEEAVQNILKNIKD